MAYLVQAFVFLLETALACVGVDMSLTAQPTPPEGGTLVGTTETVQVGVAVLKFSRGSGPSLHEYWTGYWTAAGA